MKNVFTFALLLLALSSCANTDTLSDYSRLGYGYLDGLKHDGYIVGIEKIKRKYIDTILNCENCFDEEKYQLLPADTKTNKKRNKKFLGITDDGKPMLVTHLHKYNSGGSSEIYNSYENYQDKTTCEDEELKTNCRLSGPGSYNYEKSYEAVANMALDIRANLSTNKEKPYTHILVMAMGWNNDQEESIARFNRIIDRMNEANKHRDFKPMVIGITWPSVWLSDSATYIGKKIGHIGSVFNKANDADEIGYTLMGNMLYKHILPIKEQYDIPVILIGHSYGARLVSRMLFSDVHQKAINESTPQVDFAFLLQPAFSVNRFISGEGLEGSPYDDFAQRTTRIILTTSENDTANPIAFWSRFGGGKNGAKTSKKHPKVFCKTAWVDRAFTKKLQQCGESVIVVDAESIVKNKNGIGTKGEMLSAHNDILDREMAELIWAGLDFE